MIALRAGFLSMGLTFDAAALWSRRFEITLEMTCISVVLIGATFVLPPLISYISSKVRYRLVMRKATRSRH